MSNIQATIYHKPTCPYCIAAKELLTQKGVAFEAFNVLEMSEEALAELAVRTNNHRTVPRIFIGEKFIGGYDNLSALNHSGELDELLKNA